MNCWICGKPADSGEHKVKKSLLVNVFGPGPYHGPKELLHVINGEPVPLRGPGAKQLKWEDAICSVCNNTRTQPFDEAYDQFCTYIINNSTDVASRRIVDFAEIYGPQFPAKQINLFKYFVKIFGCDLRAAGHPVPADLRRLLDLASFSTLLRITFVLNEDKLLMHNSPIGCPAGIGELATTQRNIAHKDDPIFMWSIYFAYLHIFFWYDWQISGPSGAPWIADSQFIYLGWMAPLTPEQRAKLVADIGTDTSAAESTGHASV